MTAATAAQKLGKWVEQNPLRKFRLTSRPKITIAQAAAVIGVSLVTIQKWEMGTAQPDSDKWTKLEKLIGKEAKEKWTKWQTKRPQL